MPKHNEAEELKETIKYKYRNGKKTRKYNKYCKLSKNHLSTHDIMSIEQNYLK